MKGLINLAVATWPLGATSWGSITGTAAGDKRPLSPG